MSSEIDLAHLTPGPTAVRVRADGVSMLYRGHSRTSERTLAVDRVSFSIRAGEVLGLVGASGSGKTTVARLVMGLIRPTAGTIMVDGRELQAVRRSRELRSIRRRVQMVAQDPFQALHPGMRVHELVAEPLVIHRLGTGVERRDRVRRALEDVALAPADLFLDRYPQDLSGGQRQRVAIARAIVLEPTLLVADEPTSMLDASVQMDILNVLSQLRLVKNLSSLLITHDLAVARYVCDRIAVMRAGRIVEEGPVEQVILRPEHAYTQALLEASEQ